MLLNLFCDCIQFRSAKAACILKNERIEPKFGYVTITSDVNMRSLSVNVFHCSGFVPLALVFDPFVGFEGSGDVFDGGFEDVDVREISYADAKLVGIVEKALF